MVESTTFFELLELDNNTINLNDYITNNTSEKKNELSHSLNLNFKSQKSCCLKSQVRSDHRPMNNRYSEFTLPFTISLHISF